MFRQIDLRGNISNVKMDEIMTYCENSDRRERRKIRREEKRKNKQRNVALANR